MLYWRCEEMVMALTVCITHVVLKLVADVV